MKTPRILLLATALLPLVYACDKATPVAPSGAVLTLSASPAEIAANGTSTITVRARRENGTPVNPGTQVLLSTTLGQLSATTVETDDAGVATAILTGGGRPGEAKLIARSGPSESNEVTVQVGRLAAAVSLQATPSSIPETGGTITLLALVRDSQGQPVSGVPVNFQTDIGTLASGGAFRNTDNQGQRSDTLTVSSSDLLAFAGDQFEVTVQASGSGGSTQNESSTILIQRPPIADFDTDISGLLVAFDDQSTGRPTDWDWDFGDGSTSQSQNPSHRYQCAATSCDFAVTLTVRNSIGESSITKIVTVSP